MLDFDQVRASPFPLTWFDSPRCHTRLFPPGGRREAELFFRALAHSYFAGAADPPSGATLRRHIRAASLTGTSYSRVWHLFASIRGFDLNPLLASGGLTIHELARAIHLTGIRRAAIVTWINQFAARPSS